MMQVFSQTGDAAAAQRRHRLAAGSSGVEVALATVLPGVVGVDGHVPNQLQEFLLQVLGGLQLASGLDSAVTTFRNEGTWQRSLSSLLRANCDASSSRVDRHDERHHTSIFCMPSDRHHAAAAAANRSCSKPPGLSGLRVDPGMANSCQPVLQAALHEHPCTRQTTARFGAFRHCAVCNVRMPRAVSYFRCAEGCRFPARPEQAHAPATFRLVSESTRESACANAAIQPQLTRFTRFLCLPRDEFANRIREMVNTQQFAGIGRPDLRMEGSTTWGAWFRLFHTRVASGTKRPVRGSLPRFADDVFFLHGEEQTTRELLLPLYWTYTSLEAMQQASLDPAYGLLPTSTIPSASPVPICSRQLPRRFSTGHAGPR